MNLDLILKLDIIVTFIVILIILILGFLVINKNQKSRINKIFSIFTIYISCWIIANYFGNKPELIGVQNTIIALKADLAIAIIAIFYFFLFVINFQSNKKYLHIVYHRIFYYAFLLVTFFITLLTDLVVTNVLYSGKGIQFDLGLLFPFYSIYIAGGALTSVVVMIVRYRKSKGIKKQKILWMIWGLGLSFGITVFINLGLQPYFELPAYLHRMGIYCFLFLIFFTSYAIIKYRLLNIKSVAQRFFSWLISIAFLFFVFYLFVNIFDNVFLLTQSYSILFAAVLTIIISTLIFQIIINYFNKVTNSLFFNNYYNYEEVTDNINKIIGKEIDLDSMLKKSFNIIMEALNTEKVVFMLYDDKLRKFEPRKQIGFDNNKDFSFHKISPVVQFMFKDKEMLILDELEIKIESNDLDSKRASLAKKAFKKLNSLGAYLCQPVLKKGEMIAFICFGEKLSGDPYDSKDFMLIKSFANQITITIQNFLVYEKLKKQNKELEKSMELMIGRELKMVELKKEIQELKIKH